MLKNINILLIRCAPAIETEIRSLLRASMQNGAIVDISKVRNMINKDSPVSVDDSEYLNAIAASYAPIASFLGAGYSPVVVLGAFSVDSMNSFIADYSGKGVVSVSLYVNDDTLAHLLLKKKNRETHIRLHATDTLVRRKNKRRLHYASLESTQVINRYIYETRCQADVCIDMSALDADSVVAELLRSVNALCNKEEA